MTNFKEEVNTVVNDVIEHTESIMGIIGAAQKALRYAASDMTELKESLKADDATSAIDFLEDADALIHSIGALSPRIESLMTEIDSVRHQINLTNKESN